MKQEDAYSFLRHSGLRMTKFKREIVDLFLSGGCGLSAGDVMEHLSSDPDLSTVYRVLNSLAANGFLRNSVSPDGVIQYRCTSEFYPDHGHFCCMDCGRTIPVGKELPDTFLLLLQKEYGVVVKPTDFLLEGKCLKCRKL